VDNEEGFLLIIDRTIPSIIGDIHQQKNFHIKYGTVNISTKITQNEQGVYVETGIERKLKGGNPKEKVIKVPEKA
jgi:uncharacterized OsmC-like protein